MLKVAVPNVFKASINNMLAMLKEVIEK